ncbi:MAG TPA: GAF domain-containing SpoIIE family protein phosphatase [Acidimicrobiales bacterium]|nr:GAF domain-containing SpoIIE family protein phosphatase [Acidimicrobiales bacterium]
MINGQVDGSRTGSTIRGSDGRLRLATALSGAATLDEVARIFGRWGPSVAGSAFANLAVYDPLSRRVRVVHGPSLASEIADRWEEFPIETPTPLCTAIMTGEGVLLGDLPAIEEHYALLLEDTEASGLQATASLPLRAQDGSVIGAIGLAWPTAQRFDDLQLSHLGVIAELVARAMQQVAVRSAEERALRETGDGLQSVHALQEALLGRGLRRSPGLEVATAYLPASDAPMGGDWYDLFQVADATCLVVGDIAGHGIDAVAAMAELKHAVRAYAAEDPTPSAVVERTNRFAHRIHDGLTATMIVATWQPQTRTLSRCNAGHPPMLRYDRGRWEYTPLRLGPNPMIGADPAYRYREERYQVEPGTTLMLYSDGLVENPPEGIDGTMQRLIGFCEDLPTVSPARLVNEALSWRLRQGPAPDDICLMAVRFV